MSVGAASAAGAPEPIRGNDGANIAGPTNPARQAQDPFTVTPPGTDHGTLPNMKWSFTDSHARIEEGGWARETTIRELPISTAMAGVNMRLKANVARELHWHKEAEWSYVLAGRRASRLLTNTAIPSSATSAWGSCGTFRAARRTPSRA